MYERFPDLVSPCSFEVAHACQIAIGHLEKGVLTLDHVPGLFASVPRPMSQGGVKAAAQTLFEFTSRFTREHHRRFHSDASPRGCKFDPAGYVVHVYAGIPEWHTIDIAAIVRALDLIRFGGHLSKGGYDVPNGRHTKSASAPAVHG